MTRSAQWTPTRFQTTSTRRLLRHSSLALATTALFLLSCAAPMIFSGGNLPPEQQAKLQAGNGVKITRIDSTETSARAFVMAPGTYALQVTSKRDYKSSNAILAGIIEEMKCKLQVELQPGEVLQITSQLKRNNSRFKDGYDMTETKTVVKLRSSIEGRTRVIDTSGCAVRLDCSRADRKHVAPVGCDD